MGAFMGQIYIVGLGPGDGGLITSQTWSFLEGDYPIYLRTKIHPSVEAIEAKGISYISFDHLYDKMDNFDVLYEAIVEDLLKHQKEGDLIYAVPGSPLVAEKTVRMLLEKAPKGSLFIQPGMSFLEVLYTHAHIDPVEGLYITEGSDIEEDSYFPKGNMIITQLYNQRIASDVKLSLMNHFDDEALVTVVHHLSLDDERIEEVPLYALDRLTYIDHLSSLIVPKDAKRVTFDVYNDTVDIMPLVDVMEALRGPAGCPWDKKQTHMTLRRYLLEETAEVLEAIDHHDVDNLKEELGDVLFQILFHARIAEENGHFTMQEIIDGIVDKMIRRHPHVFGEIKVANAQEVSLNWEAIKAKEKGKEDKRIMDSLPETLPTLLRAQKMQEKAAKVGFNWDSPEGIWQKLEEEITEFKCAIEKDDAENMEKEAGDILFCLINLLEWYKISGENALRQTNYKFLQRFAYVEERVRDSGRKWSEFSLDELDYFWVLAKKHEKD